MQGLDLAVVAELLEIPHDQASSVMRAFLSADEKDVHDIDFYYQSPYVVTWGDVVDRLDETHSLFGDWWRTDGADDDFDRVVETYFGYRTLRDLRA